MGWRRWTSVVVAVVVATAGLIGIRTDSATAVPYAVPITRIAGQGDGDGGQFSAAVHGRPEKLAFDAAGNLYFTDSVFNRVRKVATNGVITTVAGTGEAGYSGDGGQATAAKLKYPTGVAVDSAGALYIADTDNRRIRKVSTSGVITTVAGNGTFGSSGDNGPATSAQFGSVSGIAIDSTGVLYLADFSNHALRKVTTGGVITTIAGTGASFANNVAASASDLTGLSSVGVDSSNNIYTLGQDLVRKINASDGKINTVAGGGAAINDGGPATNAKLGHANSIAFDGAGNYYIANGSQFTIRKVNASNIISTYAGTTLSGDGSYDGPATDFGVTAPTGVAFFGGSIYFATENHILKVTAGTMSLISGAAIASSGNNGQALQARFQDPGSITRDSTGNLYVVDAANNRVRKIATDGTVYNFAGTGAAGHTGDGGLATNAQLDRPLSTAVDRNGNVFIADYSYIRKVTPGGIITTVAGSGVLCGDPDVTGATSGPAADVRLCETTSFNFDQNDELTFVDVWNGQISRLNRFGEIDIISTANVRYADRDQAGNFYYSSTYSHTVWKLDPAGNHTLLAGDDNQPIGQYESEGDSGDGGPGSAARLHTPTVITCDEAGNVYFLDSGNGRVRKIDAAGVITTAFRADTLFGVGGGLASAGVPGISALDIARNGNFYIGSAVLGSVFNVTSFAPATSSTVVSIEVLPSMSITISGLATTCAGVTPNTSGTATLVNLGKVNAGSVKTGGNTITATSNASAFAVIVDSVGTNFGTVMVDGRGHAFADSAGESYDPMPLTAGSGQFGMAYEGTNNGGTGSSGLFARVPNEIENNPAPILVGMTGQNSVTGCVVYGASASPTTPAGSYRTIMKYTAIAVF